MIVHMYLSHESNEVGFSGLNDSNNSPNFPLSPCSDGRLLLTTRITGLDLEVR